MESKYSKIPSLIIIQTNKNLRITFDFHLMALFCEKFHISITIWFTMFLLSLSCYWGFVLWTKVRFHLQSTRTSKFILARIIN